MKKNILFGLAVAALLSAGALASCGNQPDPDEGKSYSELLGLTKDELQKKVLGEYDALYKKGAQIVDPAKQDERFKAFAEAEYNLIYESSIIVPWYTKNGYYATVSKLVPYQSMRATYGLSADRLKNFVVADKAIDQETRQAIKADWDTKKLLPITPSVDEEGFTSLENQNANPAAVDGKYTVAGKTITLADTYKYSLSKDPQTLNYLNSQWTYNSYVFGNQVEGLVENDRFGNIVGAIAKNYKVEENEDGTETWTFKLREESNWIDNKTKAKYADVKADDFVAGIEWVLTKSNGSPTAGVVMDIKGAKEFYDGTQTDFSKVGVKALDEHTIQYTLKQSVPYFLSMLTYAPFLPVNRAYMTSKGTNFGATVNDILVNGPYTVSEHTQGTKITFAKNESYWDKDHVYVSTIPCRISQGTDTITTGRTLFENGELDGFTVQAKDEEGWKKYVAGNDGTGTVQNPANANCNAVLSIGDATYIGYFNFNRASFEYNDNKQKKTSAQKKATANALVNKSFRQGFLYGLDPIQYLKLTAANPVERLMRGYTNRELISHNGKDYADYVDEVFNRKQGTSGVTLTGINNGSDPVYNIDKAVNLFKAAKKELIDSKTLKESDFPIVIDVIAEMDTETAAFSAAMYAEMNKKAGDVVKVQFNTPATEDQDTQWGSVINNYDFSMWSGWGPDYADPNTFLHTMCIGGDMVSSLGF